MSIFNRRSRFSYVLALLLLCLCSKDVVYLGPAVSRYDHNRSKTIIIQSKSGDTLFSGLVSDNIYTPKGSKVLPVVTFKNSDSLAKDNLPPANLAPIFNGIMLPLQDTSQGKEQSDKKDLIDFLSKGPLAQCGVTIPDMSGDSKGTSIAYKEALDFLSSINNLRGGRDTVISKLKGRNLPIAGSIMESRYRDRAFSNILGFKQNDFWFVLYKLPGMDYYSRLVVVPATSKRPARSEEKP